MLKSSLLARFLVQAPVKNASPSSYPRVFRPSATSALKQQHLRRKPFSPITVARNSSRFITSWRTSIFRPRGNVRYNSTNKVSPEQSTSRPLSTSEKLKDLSRRYGYAALGVYLGLSALDFPFCFLAVRMLGPERVGEAEHYVVDGFWNLVSAVVPSMKPAPREVEAAIDTPVIDAKNGHGEKASIWTQLLIAYGVHKSLIFFRVPITAAITPNIVKYLRKRGWNIGRPKL